MTKYFTSTFPVINLYKKKSNKSEIITQMIYGESFSVIKKSKKWLKIKILEDNYKGFIKSKKFKSKIKPTHKVNKIKAIIYKFPNKKKVTVLTFGSKIKIEERKNNFFKFEKGWIKSNDVSSIESKSKDYFNNINIFRNVKYKWGGKTFKGIDCSALVQVFLNFNNVFCPRDAKDQNKFFKKEIKIKNLKKNDLIYWKGHVAIALSKNRLIHAYGQIKKTVIMEVNKTINRIRKTANLKVISIKRL